MPQYRLYISDDEDRALREVALRIGQRPLDTLRVLVKKLARDEKILSLEPFLRRVIAQNDALYLLLEAVAGEVGFTSGAIRFSAGANQEMSCLAAAKETSLGQLAEGLKAALGVNVGRQE